MCRMGKKGESGTQGGKGDARRTITSIFFNMILKVSSKGEMRKGAKRGGMKNCT